jgi:hypothetical protein
MKSQNGRDSPAALWRDQRRERVSAEPSIWYTDVERSAAWD